MPDLLMKSLAPAILDRIDLLPFDRPNDVADNSRPRYQRRANLRVPFTADKQYAIKRNGLLFSGLAIVFNQIPRRHLMLPPAVIDNRVHADYSAKLRIGDSDEHLPE